MATPDIKTRIFILLIGTFLFLEAINICTGSVFLYVSYKNLEHEFETGNNERVLHALINEINALEMTTSDWATWDDMYDFVITQNASFRNSNFNITSLENNKLNILYCFDRDGRKIWGMDYDFERDKTVSYGLLPHDRLDSSSPLSVATRGPGGMNNEPVSGILDTPEGYLLFSACPIVRSDRSGSPDGTLVMGKFLDQSLRDKLAKQTNLTFEVVPAVSVPIDRMNIPMPGKAAKGSFIRIESNGDNYFYTPVTGLNGGKLFYIKRLSTGEIRKNGAHTIIFTQLLLLLSTATVGAVFLIAFTRWVISPVGNLLTRIRTAKTSIDSPDDGTSASGNEIEILSVEFNSLLEKTNHMKSLLEEKTQQLENLARIDQLTQLYNRRYLDDMMRSEWNRLKKENRPLTFILLDVDYFKSYNDTYGHVEGDECLKKIAGIIRSTATRLTDISARYGGDELALLLPGTDENGGFLAASGIVEGLKECAIEHSGSSTGIVTISVGVATMIPSNENKSTEIIKNTDRALYQAKNNGRNRITVFKYPQ